MISPSAVPGEDYRPAFAVQQRLAQWTVALRVVDPDLR
jgi:hypothetical protein